jgi:hypothetical protein
MEEARERGMWEARMEASLSGEMRETTERARVES